MSLIGIAAYCHKGFKEFIQFDKNVIPVSTLLLLILLIASIDRRISLKKESGIKVFFWIGWYLCFITMFITSLMYHVRDTYFLWGVLSLSVFPMLMIVWSDNRRFSHLCLVAAHSMMLSGLLFFVISILVTPFVTNTIAPDVGYLGIASNPNGNGLIIVPFFTASLYLVAIGRRLKPVHLFTMIISIVFAVISVTRTAELAIILEILAALIIYIRHKELYKKNRLSAGAAVIILVTIIAAAMFGAALKQIDRVDMKAYAESEMEESVQEVLASPMLIKMNSLSSGRLIIWKAYLKTVGFKGHGSPEGALFPGYEATKWAHNNAIDIWYASGFIAFAGYVLWLISVCVFVIRCLFGSGRYRREYLLTVLAFIGYFVEAMLEITLYPMFTGIAFLSFITLTPAAFAEPETHEDAVAAVREYGKHYKGNR